MAQQEQRIRGVFNEGPAPKEESGLRARPRPTFRDRQDELRSSLPDLSDQAVELPDEDDYLDDVQKSDTIPPGRVTADDVARVAAHLSDEPPALPVPLSRRPAPPLPLPLTRKSAPTLAELGARLPVTPMPESDAERIDLDEVARDARSALPAMDVDAGLALAAESARRARRMRAVGVVAALLALVGVGWVAGAIVFRADDRGVASAQPVVSETAAPAQAEPVLVLDTVDVRTEPQPMELGTVHVRSVPAEVTPREDEAAPAPAAAVRASAPVVVRTPAVPAPAGVEEPAPAGVEVPAPADVEEPAPADVEEPALADVEEPAAIAEESATEVAAPEAAALPEAPSRDEVVAALRPLESDVLACAEGHFGVVPVRITVASSGRVTTAQVTGGTVVGTPAGSCIARTLRRAHFPAFTQDRFVVDYPFSL